MEHLKTITIIHLTHPGAGRKTPAIVSGHPKYIPADPAQTRPRSERPTQRTAKLTGTLG